MRIVLAIAFCVAVAWGVVSFFASNKPAPAAVAQHVDHRKFREALIKAADWDESSPCDPKYKESLHQAFLAYIADTQTTTEIPDVDLIQIAKGVREAHIANSREMTDFGRLVLRDETMTPFHSVPKDYVPPKDRHFACGGDTDNRSAAPASDRPMALPTNSGK